MSSGDPAFWSGRAPLLFPIVGRLNGDTLRHDGKTYPMQKHGFVRKSAFSLVDAKADEALFRLTDSAETRAQYPFAFELDAHFRVDDNTLNVTTTVHNRSEDMLPFSFGYHPAFAWPLPFGGERAHHAIRFEHDEPATLRRVTPYGTISAEAVPSPVVGSTLKLTDALFADDALVWTQLKSSRLTYGAPGHASLDIGFPDTEWLGIWTKPGAAFVCIEPWAGIADPEDYAGAFTDKPGINSLAPGGVHQFRMNIRLVD